jgi:hypothetical protein
MFYMKTLLCDTALIFTPLLGHSTQLPHTLRLSICSSTRRRARSCQCCTHTSIPNTTSLLPHLLRLLLSLLLLLHLLLLNLQLNKSLREKLSALHTTRVLAGLLGDVLVAARRLRELMAASIAPAAAAAGGDGAGDAAVVLKLLKLALDPVEQQVSCFGFCLLVCYCTECCAGQNSSAHLATCPVEQQV